jgi:rubrerythrin
MDKKEKMEAIKLALTNEKKEKEFYLENAERTNDQLGEAMFRSIASDEDEHYRRLQELYDKLEERDKWPEDFSTDISSAKVGEIFDRVIRQRAGESGGNEDDVAALKVALAFEENGERFYADLAEKSDNEAEKHFFTMLSSMEREHRLSLEQTLEYFDDPKGWMERMGGRHLDGA